MSLILTNDQQNALDKFTSFLTDPKETVFVLEGYSGTGKSTLVTHLFDILPNLQRTMRLLGAKMDYETRLTATTNKAAENLAQITGMDVSTIHSFLELRVDTDYKTGNTSLIPRSKMKKAGYLLFIDEASYIDSALLQLIFQQTERCKIVFIGDPAQLSPVKSNTTPVFSAGFLTARLEQVVRQAAGNPIIDLATKFRETVNTGEFFKFTPDGVVIQHHSRDDFDDLVLQEFTRPTWRHRDSRFLAWTNKRVIDYNHAIQNKVQGTPAFQVGDYAVCNSFVTCDRKSIKTDQMVYITGISELQHRHDVPGFYYTLDYGPSFFGAQHLADLKQRVKDAQACNEYSVLREIDTSWVDLRSAFASTINKSQGSTYDRVFIDLDDIARCNSGDQIARMMYVAVSRARYGVFLTGDLA